MDLCTGLESFEILAAGRLKNTISYQKIRHLTRQGGVFSSRLSRGEAT